MSFGVGLYVSPRKRLAQSRYVHRRARTVITAPTQLSGLRLWLDPSDAATRFQDSALSLPGAADNDPIGGWVDKSGNSNTVTMATAGARPTIKTAVQNGRDIIRFDGVDDRLTKSTVGIMNGVTGATFACVFRTTNAAALQGLLYISRFSVSNSTKGLISLNNPTAGYGAGGRRLNTDGFETALGGTVDTVAHVIVGQLNYTNATAVVRVDGVEVGADNPFQTTGTSAADDSAIMAVGSINAGSFFVGDMGEVLAYNRALTQPEMMQLEAYLKAKWGTP